jgi:OmpR-family two-component system manganese-sensing sensor histidine kinase
MRVSDRQKIEMMVDAADQIGSILQALLRLADLEHRPRKEDLAQIFVEKLIADVCRDLNELATVKSIEFRVEITDASLSFFVVETDARTALLNVLRNAIAYSNEGSVVNIRAKKAGRFVQFQIQDFGIGIDAKDLGHIFDRFWRPDKARSYRSISSPKAHHSFVD